MGPIRQWLRPVEGTGYRARQTPARSRRGRPERRPAAAVAGEGRRHAPGQRGAVADAGEGSRAEIGSWAGRSQSQARAGRGLGAWSVRAREGGSARAHVSGMVEA